MDFGVNFFFVAELEKKILLVGKLKETQPTEELPQKIALKAGKYPFFDQNSSTSSINRGDALRVKLRFIP
jgi:hypothetical protein